MGVRAPGALAVRPFNRNGFCRRGNWLAGLRPPPAPAPAFREGVNVLFPGTQEIQKVHAHVFAGLATDKSSVIRLKANGTLPPE